jgi:hypothetical protein
MDWSNRDTELVADMIRGDSNFLQSTIQEDIATKKLISRDADIMFEADSIASMFARLDDSGKVIVDDDFQSAFHLLGIDPEKVDWYQLASWQIKKFNSRK